MTLRVLGINIFHGDTASALVEDGKLLNAVEEERITRVKHASGVPEHALKNIFQFSKISINSVHYFCIARDPLANFFRKISFALISLQANKFLFKRFKVLLRTHRIKGLYPNYLNKREDLLAENIHVEHHLSHAASAFYPSGFEKAALLTVDGFGDFSSTMFAVGEGNRINVLKRIIFPHSLGLFYTVATQFLGFPRYGDEYKVMGLAAYGEPRFLKEFREILRLQKEGSFKLNIDYFVHQKGKMEMTWEGGEPTLSPGYSGRWQKIFGPPRNPEEPVSQQDKDLAASLQAAFEEAYFHLMNYLYTRTKLKNLCLAGGCAFNSVANGKIFDRTSFQNVYIQPAAGDAGTALGSALYLSHHRLNQPRNFVMDHAYWGPEYSDNEILGELNRRQMTAQKIEDEAALCQKTATAIAEGKVVGWFQGRMEWGPRALGNRSILADPRRAQMRDILNERIKMRETFRPFAPSVLEEKADEWFQMKTRTSPFMNFVFPVRPEKKGEIPAVTHVDGTARVHTVSKKTNGLFWNLIHEFDRQTGVPLLLNTSFNENEPIVCTPTDALNCFFKTKMDLLVMGSYWIERKRSQDE